MVKKKKQKNGVASMDTDFFLDSHNDAPQAVETSEGKLIKACQADASRRSRSKDMDCISSLHDNIIQHILSFLQTREAAKTSILSKRWRNLWAYTPVLDIENHYNHGKNDMENSKFNDAISSHKSLNLLKLRLRLSTYYGAQKKDCPRHRPVNALTKKFLDKLFNTNFRTRTLRIQELDIFIECHWSYSGKLYKLPRFLFSSGSLRILKLSNCTISDVGTMKLAHVETLSLASVRAVPVGTLNDMIAACCKVKKIELILLTMDTEIDLSLHELRKMMLSYVDVQKYFKLDASKLQYVKLTGYDDNQLGLSRDNIYKLPRFLFPSGGLHSLILKKCEITNFGGINLAGVVTLSLFYVSAEPAKALNDLIAASYNVRNLELNLITIDIDLDLSLLELRKMVISRSTFPKSFIINAPKLQHVEFSSNKYHEGFQFSMENSLNLKYAWLQSHNSITEIKDLVCEFGLAKVLKLDANYCDFHQDLFENSTLCYSVKKLLLDNIFTSLPLFLMLFPNLQDLSITCHKLDRYNSENIDEVDLSIASVNCLRNSMKKIKIKNFRGYNTQTWLANFLVENALVLESMTLTNCYGDALRLFAIREDLISNRASQTAQIEYIYEKHESSSNASMYEEENDDNHDEDPGTPLDSRYGSDFDEDMLF